MMILKLINWLQLSNLAFNYHRRCHIHGITYLWQIRLLSRSKLLFSVYLIKLGGLCVPIHHTDQNPISPVSRSTAFESVWIFMVKALFSLEYVAWSKSNDTNPLDYWAVSFIFQTQIKAKCFCFYSISGDRCLSEAELRMTVGCSNKHRHLRDENVTHFRLGE